MICLCYRQNPDFPQGAVIVNQNPHVGRGSRPNWRYGRELPVTITQKKWHLPVLKRLRADEHCRIHRDTVTSGGRRAAFARRNSTRPEGRPALNRETRAISGTSRRLPASSPGRRLQQSIWSGGCPSGRFRRNSGRSRTPVFRRRPSGPRGARALGPPPWDAR